MVRFFFEASDLENYMLDNLETFMKQSVRIARMFSAGSYHYGTCVRVMTPKNMAILNFVVVYQ